VTTAQDSLLQCNQLPAETAEKSALRLQPVPKVVGHSRLNPLIEPGFFKIRFQFANKVGVGDPSAQHIARFCRFRETGTLGE